MHRKGEKRDFLITGTEKKGGSKKSAHLWYVSCGICFVILSLHNNHNIMSFQTTDGIAKICYTIELIEPIELFCTCYTSTTLKRKLSHSRTVALCCCTIPISGGSTGSIGLTGLIKLIVRQSLPLFPFPHLLSNYPIDLDDYDTTI